MTAMSEYRSALQRLIANEPTVVPKGSKICNDTVALEAGRGRGSIKKSRPEFLPLILEIEQAAAKFRSKSPMAEFSDLKLRNEKLLNELSGLKAQHAVTLNKLMSVLHYNFQLQQEIKRLGGSVQLINTSCHLGEEIT